MQRSLLALAILTAGTASATPFTGNDTRSSAMGNTGVASADSFAASQFNPALLSAYEDNVDFGLQLPSIMFSIDDGYGFIKAVNVAQNFENTDTDAILREVGELPDAVAATSDAADEFNDGIDAGELDAYNEANQALDDKIDTIQSELRNLEVAVDDTNDSMSTLPDKPLALLGSIGTAIAIPRSGLGLALHLNTSANVGMRANIADDDLNTLELAVDDTLGYTDEADQLTTLSAEVSAAAEVLSGFNEAGDPCSGTIAYQNAYNDFLIAQANLEAESNGTTINLDSTGGDPGDLCSGTHDADYDGNNVSTYTSVNGFYVNGEFDSTATDGFGENSTVTILGANVIELGVSAAREFTYMGQTFSVGVTPKLQSLQIFEDTIAFDEAGNFDTSTLSQNTTTAFTGNLDIGVAKNWYNIWGGQVRAGLAVKDLIPQTFESASGRELSMGPKARIGAAHETRFSTVALDLDLTENEPLGYGVTTRYIGLGGELDAFNWMKVRAGYRNNLSVDDSHVITTGLGFTPFGTGLDLTAWFSPASFDEWEDIVRDAGFATQFSMNW
ncbi:conjugal transfer protein TraF [Saccharospirillum mangrovi]|uniref:conjugal transfer protein TraF n=1 Tax=Saccharospirillum mangrovi TaxID=2161747 RepID=UPI0013004877|nr:conjugal transfer protein TraF [Saccharospirillum mangrovi]